MMDTKDAKKEPDLPGADESSASPTPAGQPAAEPESHSDEAKGTPHTHRHAAETLADRLDPEAVAETKRQ